MKKPTDKQYAVLGLGVFGRNVVKTLIRNGCEVLACDIDPAVVREAASYATHVVQADVTDENDLNSIAIGSFDVVIVAIGDGFEPSILATMMAKEKGVPYVLTKAKKNRQKKILESVGADRVVLPERESGEKIAMNLITGNMIDHINLSEDYAIAEIAPRENWIGKTLESARIRADNALNVIAIRRGFEVIVAPRADEKICKGDVLAVLGENASIQKFR